jgi:hypothetical protein
MDLRVGTKVRFNEPYRPSQVRWGAIGVIVDTEERRTTFGPAFFVRARFGFFYHTMDRGVEIGAGKLTWRGPFWSLISAAR